MMATRNVTVSLTRNAVDMAIGVEAARFVAALDHNEMAFGVHWRWHREQVFTPAGLMFILERLEAAHPDAVSSLEGAIAYAEKNTEDGPAPIGELVKVERLEAPEEELAKLTPAKAHKSDREPRYYWQDFD